MCVKFSLRLFFLLVICFNYSQFFAQEKSDVKKVDGKAIEYSESSNELDANPALSVLTGDLKSYIKSSQSMLGVLANFYGVVLDKPNSFNPTKLDKIFVLWKKDKNPNKPTKDEIVSILGACFGGDLVENLNFEWMLLNDKFGTDIVAIHKVYDLKLFPFNSVEKACSEDKNEFMEAISLYAKNEIIENKDKLMLRGEK